MHEAHRDGNFRTSSLAEWKESDFGSNVVTSFEVVGMGDLTTQMKFISPDDGNPDDKTVFQVKLPRPVPPGQDVTFKISFKAKFPRSSRAPATSGRSSSRDSGSPRSACGGTASGIAISSTP